LHSKCRDCQLLLLFQKLNPVQKFLVPTAAMTLQGQTKYFLLLFVAKVRQEALITIQLVWIAGNLFWLKAWILGFLSTALRMTTCVV
jgi:hypothetical protein